MVTNSNSETRFIAMVHSIQTEKEFQRLRVNQILSEPNLGNVVVINRG